MNPERPQQFRGKIAKHFIRPKPDIDWLILERDNLRTDEEAVRFANFSVSEVMLNN